MIFLIKNGITDCWVSQSKDDLGKRLAKKVRKDKTFVNQLGKNLKELSKRTLTFIKASDAREINLKVYNNFWLLVGRYYLPHLCVKYIVDYLTSKELQKFLPILEEARLYAEPVFRETENFMEKIAQHLVFSSGYDKNLILSTTKEDLKLYFKSKVLPDKNILHKRYSKSAMIFNHGNYQIFSGSEVDKIEKIVIGQKIASSLKGQIAYKGKARGRVRIVIDPRKEGVIFKKGEILVTGMTRPEFLPIMERAAAFVTDAGGILSHAAIVARELKKPPV